MGRAEDLFQSINLESIVRFVEDGQEEHLHLDFKTADPRLSRDDRKNLAEAVSGFANSDGGVIVWGVDARSGGPDGADLARQLKPIDPLSVFMGQVNSMTGEAANPTVDGVKHRPFLVSEEEDRGYAATLIPASDSGPHMAKLGHDRYFKRSGSRFVRMEHFDIEDMFGRRKKPVLRLTRHLRSGSINSGGGRPSWREVVVIVGIENTGRGSASAPYLHVEVAEPYRAYPTPVGPSGLMPLAEDVGHYSRTLVGRSDFVIHPGVRFDLIRISTPVPDAAGEYPDLQIAFRLAAENFRVVSETLVVPGGEILRVVR